ncbi:hypothetical protein BA718_02065 [Streptococcus gallolyticus subsp. gallolyticus]|uniref:DUF1351 domain-containing protein n=1 Tax=Streptococcus gallolyticus TaxID=315405 RepID=UPI0007E3D42E|nr:DUF1351 domain-containing protein [Streptococcus gallolyticus]OAV82341.1 hypothetical protein A3651_02045 [Streptococcus gallolyticus subsp. gallolyticus]OCW49769.1 hypothetical protein BA718_02065 [Streptococcus gallolyticus subsp. gallolyticus]QBX16044.1 hypothetical protein Javan231_0023 [Streptococcus phage Javan231]QBX16103.1 hypothetical protein Javan233_0023 [Streptococcus phage Javan233]
MQELQVNVKQAEVEIVDREKFEQGINAVVAKYQNYTVTASTIKGDKKVLADLRKLQKQISDERIKIKRELSKPTNDFDTYVKEASEPINDIVNKIASDVKEFEDNQKAMRLDTVKGYIANKCSEYLLDPRIFDEKATEFIKAGDFMADGVTLKKVTMKSLDDAITFELQKQQEFEKAKAAISGQCAEYNMTDQPYIRMLNELTLVEVLEQIKSDYRFEQQKEEARKVQEAELARQRTPESQETPKFDPETGEILESDELSQNKETALREVENSSKRYTQKMTLEVYFADSAEKDFFKAELEKIGFEYKKNYAVSGYKKIKPLTQEELTKLFN